MTHTTTYRFLGTTNDRDTCDCCGRTGLKRTVVLGVLDADGTVTAERYLGTVCAARAFGQAGKAISTLVESQAVACGEWRMALRGGVRVVLRATRTARGFVAMVPASDAPAAIVAELHTRLDALLPRLAA